MEIKIQLDDDRAQKLAYIQEQTQQDLAELVGEAIDRQYARLRSSDGDSLARFKQSKFIGSFSGSPDLSTNAKAVFRSIMDEKYPV